MTTTATASTAAAAYWEPLWAAGRRYRQLEDTENQLLGDHLGPGRARPALDIGCGDGALARRLAQLGYRTTGIDCSPSAIALAAAKAPGPGRVPLWQCMDITTDDLGTLPEPAYAVITCRLVYRWIDDKPAFLDRVRRLLAPGGICVGLLGAWEYTPPVLDAARLEEYTSRRRASW
ncbi:class I SAM-dependent methyltransferase [Streptomyces ardesiacus]